GGRRVSKNLLWKDVPVEQRGKVSFILDLIDWDLNLDPQFRENRFMRPRHARGRAEEGFTENWIVYRSPSFSAKELTVLPARTVTVNDEACYGMIAIQGRGQFGPWPLETPTLIRFGELTWDEFFVSETAAANGVSITNSSSVEPLVILKHFG